jgi:hypothetical protein
MFYGYNGNLTYWTNEEVKMIEIFSPIELIEPLSLSAEYFILAETPIVIKCYGPGYLCNVGTDILPS